MEASASSVLTFLIHLRSCVCSHKGGEEGGPGYECTDAMAAARRKGARMRLRLPSVLTASPTGGR
eukprot:scaffold100399_cov35-Tisochrysis_lutea.AAC.3